MLAFMTIPCCGLVKWYITPFSQPGSPYAEI
jgi:hypothetical protein